jgi:hypothetical protein
MWADRANWPQGPQQNFEINPQLQAFIIKAMNCMGAGRKDSVEPLLKSRHLRFTPAIRTFSVNLAGYAQSPEWSVIRSGFEFASDKIATGGMASLPKPKLRGTR